MDKLPGKTRSDAAYAVVNAVTAAAPVVGGTLSVLFETVFTPPIVRRQEKWLQTLADTVSELLETVEGLSPQALSDNEAFITVASQATQIALRNHQEEKLEALRNAVRNSGSTTSLSEDRQLMFLRFVDELTTWHLRVFTLLRAPDRWMDQHNVQYKEWESASVGGMIGDCFEELLGQREYCSQLVRDLQARGLVQQGDFLHETTNGLGVIGSRFTELGLEFFEFVSA
jgi:hypothetical protein